MSIPLDRLYHFIENIAEEIHGDRVIIYRFWPNGSKNLNDFYPLYSPTNFKNYTLDIKIFCADQEPLAYDYYEQFTCSATDNFNKILIDLGIKPKFGTNLAYTCYATYKHHILLHSEKRSVEVEKYQQVEYCSAYYWSHALIARDWFRFAEHVQQQKQVKKTFLIYNRAWSNTREYRLRFAELLVTLGLHDHCQTSVNPVEPELGIHYKTHKFKNSAWSPQTILENYFPVSNAHSHYSADFDIKDYEATDVEVVLETLFDDGRLHLTEKSLRPIACGQPFILAGTHGSLEYLRSYGFKTFGDIWDESYDAIENPQERMYAITDLMVQVANWGPIRERKLAEAQAVADYNREYFFSDKFFNFVVNELTNNLKNAFSQSGCSIKNIKSMIDLFESILVKKNSKTYVEKFFNTNFLEISDVLKIAKLQYQKLLSIDK